VKAKIHSYDTLYQFLLEARLTAHIRQFKLITNSKVLVKKYMIKRIRHKNNNSPNEETIDKLGSIMMMIVRIPTADGRMLELRCYNRPESEHQIILDILNLKLPKKSSYKVYLPVLEQVIDTICGGNQHRRRYHHPCFYPISAKVRLGKNKNH
jgi:hypothetical protein